MQRYFTGKSCSEMVIACDNFPIFMPLYLTGYARSSITDQMMMAVNTSI